MSLILDALNRSQRERGSGDAVPSLATEHFIDETASGPGWRQALPWLALLAALLVIGWLVWDRMREAGPAEEQAPVVVAAPAEPVAAPVVPVQEKPLLDSAAAAPVETPQAQAASPAPPAASLEPPAASPAVPASPPAAAQPVASGEVIDLYRQADDAGALPEASPPVGVAATEPALPEPAAEAPVTAPMTEPASEENLDIEALVRRAENELENARLAEHPAPFLADLSQQKKDQIPTLMYSRHDYASDKKSSAVTLNGKTLRAGGTAGGGVRVVEVLPDSVVLSHQGTEFRLRALNSWVNL